MTPFMKAVYKLIRYRKKRVHDKCRKIARAKDGYLTQFRRA